MRLIDADALAEEMGASCIPIMANGISGITGDDTCIMDYINNAPTIEAEPVRHGEWCWDGKLKACSECGSYVEWDNCLGANHWKYCPYCGAKMGKEG